MIHSRSMKDAECKALNCLDARFGSAVSAVGDIDLDGYQGRLIRYRFCVQVVLCVVLMDSAK